VYLLAVLPGCGGSKPPTGGSNTPDLASVTLQNNTVVAGQQVQGMVALTSAPSSGSITINLSSSSTAVATVPASVGVVQGNTTSTFQVTGVAAGTVTITASLAATQRQAQLTVNAASGSVASFRVLQGDGSSNTDANFTCPVTRDTSMGGLLNKLDCTFDGTASIAPGGVTDYIWTFFNAVNGEAAMYRRRSVVVQPFLPCGTFDGVTSRDVKLEIEPASPPTSEYTRSITVQKLNPC
jgi:hypothetical protein